MQLSTQNIKSLFVRKGSSGRRTHSLEVLPYRLWSIILVCVGVLFFFVVVVHLALYGILTRPIELTDENLSSERPLSISEVKRARGYLEGLERTHAELLRARE